MAVNTQIDREKSSAADKVRVALGLAILGVMSLIGGCASEAEDFEDTQIGSDPLAQTAPATPTTPTAPATPTAPTAPATPTAPTTAAPTAVDYRVRGPLEVMQELNVGAGFETFGIDDTVLCQLLVPALTNGKSSAEEVANFIKFPATLRPKLYTMFRPKTLEAGRVYPVVLWGNGTCSAPIYYEPLLSHLASHGFIVIAANSRTVGDGAALRTALNFLTRENGRAASPFYRKLDLTHVGAAGHTQGGDAAMNVADDPRVTSILPIEVSNFHENKKPTFFLAGANDAVITPEMTKEAYDAFEGPAVYGLAEKVDHVSPLAEAPLLQGALTAWFKATITSDPAAKEQFAGSCQFCSTPGWTFQRKNLN